MKKYTRSIHILHITLFFTLGLFFPLRAGMVSPSLNACTPSGFLLEVRDLAQLPSSFQSSPSIDPLPARRRTVYATAYTSSPEETDDTPFITASNKLVRDGIIAANFLKFGTRVLIPEFFGDKIFIVEDRMHPRKTNFIDIWMSGKEQALRFGIAETEIVVLD